MRPMTFLVAKTNEPITPNAVWNLLGGTSILVDTLDLNQDFPLIASKLDAIVHSQFPEAKKKR